MQMRKEQHSKEWNEIKTNDSWAIFKIMGEFVNGFEKMSAIGPCVSIFGSARVRPGNKYYELAVNISQRIAESVWSFQLMPIIGIAMGPWLSLINN